MQIPYAAKVGRPRVVDADKRHAILARRAEGRSLGQIARGVGVSLAVVGDHLVPRTQVEQGILPADRPGASSATPPVGSPDRVGGR